MNPSFLYSHLPATPLLSIYNEKKKDEKLGFSDFVLHEYSISVHVRRVFWFCLFVWILFLCFCECGNRIASITFIMEPNTTE